MTLSKRNPRKSNAADDVFEKKMKGSNNLICVTKLIYQVVIKEFTYGEF